MASQPPNTPPQYPPQYGYVDARAARQAARAQAQAMRAQVLAARAQARFMRRRSILGPILLLAVGIAFLLSTTRMIPPQELFFWYGRWWPVLLIGGGAVLLLEWALDTRAVNSGVPRGTRVGGGAVWLIILLVFFGMAASGTHDWNWSGFRANFDDNNDFNSIFMGPQHQADEDVEQAIPAGATVSIENQHGDITVAAASAGDSNTLKVAVHKTVYGGSDKEAQNRLENLKPIITTSGNTVVVRVQGDTNSSSANLIISVPAKSALDLRCHHGDLMVTGQQADVTIDSDHGDVKVDTITGAVRGKLEHGDFFAHAVTGDVNINGRHFSDVTVSDVTGAVTLSGDFYGDTHVEHIGSTFHLHSSRTDFEVAKLDGAFSLDTGDLSAEQAVGPLKISTRSKDISLNRVSGDVTVDNSNGGIDIESALPLGEYNIKNRNGHVKITLPENAGFIVDARSYQGDLQSDFALTRSGSENNGEITGTVGKGGPRLSLTADHGDVELRKGNFATLEPPTPPTPPHPPAPPKPPKLKPATPPAPPEPTRP